MSKRLLSAFIAIVLAAYTATPTPAPARWLDPGTAGYCISGTCSKFGGKMAANIKNCRPENCRDFVATNIKATTAIPKTSAGPTKHLCSPVSWSWLWFWPHRDCADGRQ